jgi:hypothetical protein
MPRHRFRSRLVDACPQGHRIHGPGERLFQNAGTPAEYYS